MQYPLKCGQSESLCLNENNGRIYSASSFVREYQFPEWTVVSKLCNIRHAKLCLSSNNSILSVHNNENNLKVYNTENLQQPVFSKQWHGATATDLNCRFWNNDFVLMPVQHYLYAVHISDPPRIYTIYGNPNDRPRQTTRSRYGYIQSLSTRNDEIAMIHYTFEPYESIFLYSKGTDVEKLEFAKKRLPGLMHSQYNNLLLHPSGGMCLFSSMEFPMLYYSTVSQDLQSPDKVVEFPCTQWPCFSPDGKYLTFTSLHLNSPIFYRCWLMDAHEWSVIKVLDREVWSPSFSSDGRYWLLPGPNPLIIDLTDLD